MSCLVLDSGTRVGRQPGIQATPCHTPRSHLPQTVPTRVHVSRRSPVSAHTHIQYMPHPIDLTRHAVFPCSASATRRDSTGCSNEPTMSCSGCCSSNGVHNTAKSARPWKRMRLPRSEASTQQEWRRGGWEDGGGEGVWRWRRRRRWRTGGGGRVRGSSASRSRGSPRGPPWRLARTPSRWPPTRPPGRIGVCSRPNLRPRRGGGRPDGEGQRRGWRIRRGSRRGRKHGGGHGCRQGLPRRAATVEGARTVPWRKVSQKVVKTVRRRRLSEVRESRFLLACRPAAPHRSR